MKKIFRILIYSFLIKPFVYLFIGIKISGKENLKGKNQFIIVSNHSSHLDTIIIQSIFPCLFQDKIKPVAAEDYFDRNKLCSLFFRGVFNIITIPRKNISKSNNPLVKISKELESGNSLIIYPEGTRYSDGEIHELQSGIIHISKKFPDIPIVPVYISNAYKSLPKGSVIPLPSFCTVNIGEKLYLNGEKEEIEILKNRINNLKNKNCL